MSALAGLQPHFHPLPVQKLKTETDTPPLTHRPSDFTLKPSPFILPPMPYRRLPNSLPAVIRTLKTARDARKKTPSAADPAHPRSFMRLQVAGA